MSLITFLFDFSYFYSFLLSAFISMPQVIEQCLFLFSRSLLNPLRTCLCCPPGAVHQSPMYCVRHEFLPIQNNKNYAKITPFRNAPSKLKMCARHGPTVQLDVASLRRRHLRRPAPEPAPDERRVLRHCASHTCARDSSSVGIDTGELVP